MSKLDWANLLRQNRCKALGVPWSEEELKAIHTDEIPAEYVRAGVLTTEEYEKQLKREKVEGKKLEMMSLVELQEEAAALKIETISGVTPRETLIDLIQKKRLMEEAGVEEGEETEDEDGEEDIDDVLGGDEDLDPDPEVEDGKDGEEGSDDTTTEDGDSEEEDSKPKKKKKKRNRKKKK